MALPNYSGGETYYASADSNISQLAQQVEPDGSIRVTDITPASASNSYAVMYLESGALKFKYYDTASITLSSGSDFTSLSAAAQ